MDITQRKNVEVGMLVEIFDKDKADLVEKDKFKPQEEIKYTRGYVIEVLSKGNSEDGIKVRLDNGKVGRIRKFVKLDDVRRENFKYWNIFFQEKELYSIWNKIDRRYLTIDKLMGNEVQVVGFIFSDKSQAKKLLNKLSSKDYIIQRLNNRKSVVDNFKTLGIDVYNVNLSKNVRAKSLVGLEQKFQ